MFISHASEDKQAVVLPLVRAFEARGISSWYDRAAIKWGDDIVAKVNQGLAISEYVIVVLSPTFTRKPWPEKELNAALNLEASSGQVKVLPLLCGSPEERSEILKKYPLLKGKAHLVWTGDPASVVSELESRVGRDDDVPPNEPLRRTQPRAVPDPLLLQRYLREVWGTSVKLKLTTIDRKTATGREATELDLAAVFTDLDVREAPEIAKESGRLGVIRRPESSQEESGRLSVTTALARHPRLVLLGDPGSGKSTLVNFLALCLAGEGLGDKEVNVSRLGKDWKRLRPLPIRILLRDYAARGLASNKSLWQFFQDELGTISTGNGQSLADCAPAIEQVLDRPVGALLLLDGVDEVPEAGQRRVELKKAIETFARGFPRCRILVTSRPYGYQDPEARLAEFEVRTLMDFTPEQIQTFIGRWYAHIGRVDRALGPANAERYASELKHVVQSHPRIAELAPKPLLLTLMAALHRWREGRSLPEKRHELYELSVDLLIDLWQQPKNRFDQHGRPTDKEYDVFRELGIPAPNLRRALNLLAFEAHRDQPVQEGTHDITARQLAGMLHEASADKEKANAQRIIRYITDRAGLLIERRGGKIYTFPHRTFQEYLAACHLADDDFPYELAKWLRQEDSRWREVALLAAAVANRGSNIWNLIREFCSNDWPPPDAPKDPDWFAALRATQALVETEQENRAPDRWRHLVERVRQWLIQLVTQGALPPRERAEAGRLLNRLPGGDPRVEKDEWIEIPGGEFDMGEERPKKVPVAAFRIGKYPVTNEQYRRFVEASGYGASMSRHWSPAGLEWLRGEKRQAPGYWNDPLFNLANHPLVGVSWYEAQAYCSWLTEYLQEKGEIGREQLVRLPFEREWEYAARGTHGRTWPWGNEWDSSRANTMEGGVGTTSAVGMYPSGMSPCGIFDMAGNVREWCETRYEKDLLRHLRGGSWYIDADFARAASRYDASPGLWGIDIGFRCVVVPRGSPRK